jgi:hypothetical protein
VLQGFLGWPLKAEKPYVTGIGLSPDYSRGGLREEQSGFSGRGRPAFLSGDGSGYGHEARLEPAPSRLMNNPG